MAELSILKGMERFERYVMWLNIILSIIGWFGLFAFRIMFLYGLIPIPEVIM